MRALFCAMLLAMAPAAVDAKTAKAAPRAGPAFEWVADAAGADAPLLIVVNIATQRAAVFRGEERVGWTRVSTGRAGKETPTGVFPILQKNKDHVSNIYHLPMPYMQRLTWDGIALHAGRVTGRPISAGCVRLPAAFARALFGETRRGDTVVIVDEPAADGADPAIDSPALGMQIAAAALPDRPNAPAAPVMTATARQPVGILMTSAPQ